MIAWHGVARLLYISSQPTHSLNFYYSLLSLPCFCLYTQHTHTLFLHLFGYKYKCLYVLFSCDTANYNGFCGWVAPCWRSRARANASKHFPIVNAIFLLHVLPFSNMGSSPLFCASAVVYVCLCIAGFRTALFDICSAFTMEPCWKHISGVSLDFVSELGSCWSVYQTCLIWTGFWNIFTRLVSAAVLEFNPHSNLCLN